MKKTAFILLCIAFFIPLNLANAGQVYLERYLQYRTWIQQFPEKPNAEFIDFIRQSEPLSSKLRSKWLYHLAQKEQWPLFLQYYLPSDNQDLQCLNALSTLHQEKTSAQLKQAKALLLSVSLSTSTPCQRLFQFLAKQGLFDTPFLTQGLFKALEQNEFTLAQKFLSAFSPAQPQVLQQLTKIERHPEEIKNLSYSPIAKALYLYGLKRLISKNVEKALTYWQMPLSQKHLSDAQKQAFLRELVLYKALHNDEDTLFWFNQIKPEFYTQPLLDRSIRFALKREDWKKVISLIQLSLEKENANWQYWLARAYEAEQDPDAAKAIYERLQKTRHYYGFLASYRLNLPPYLGNEAISSPNPHLTSYNTLLKIIRSYYKNRQNYEAAKILNDFSTELPKEEKSALIAWTIQELQWYHRAIYLSSVAEELNNQLGLRFPIAYRSAVEKAARTHHLFPAFIYALIRQESAFATEAISPAGAYGLMQVMPNTAKFIAKQKKIAYGDKAQLLSFTKNIEIGVAYFSQLLERYDQQLLIAAAAYNAGPQQVSKWLRLKKPLVLDIWVETLPWAETRNYLKHVLASYVIYQHLLGKTADLGLLLQVKADTKFKPTAPSPASISLQVS